jgi:hypothetical protein
MELQILSLIYEGAAFWPTALALREVFGRRHWRPGNLIVLGAGFLIEACLLALRLPKLQCALDGECLVLACPFLAMVQLTAAAILFANRLDERIESMKIDLESTQTR